MAQQTSTVNQMLEMTPQGWRVQLSMNINEFIILLSILVASHLYSTTLFKFGGYENDQ